MSDSEERQDDANDLLRSDVITQDDIPAHIRERNFSERAFANADVIKAKAFGGTAQADLKEYLENAGGVLDLEAYQKAHDEKHGRGSEWREQKKAELAKQLDNLPAPPETFKQLPAKSDAFFESKQRMVAKIETDRQTRLLEAADKGDPAAAAMLEAFTALAMSVRQMQKELQKHIIKNAFEKDDEPFEEWLQRRYSHIEACTTGREIIEHLERKDDLQSARMREIDGLEALIETYKRTEHEAREVIRNLQTDYRRVVQENQELRKALGVYCEDLNDGNEVRISKPGGGDVKRLNDGNLPLDQKGQTASAEDSGARDPDPESGGSSAI